MGRRRRRSRLSSRLIQTCRSSHSRHPSWSRRANTRWRKNSRVTHFNLLITDQITQISQTETLMLLRKNKTKNVIICYYKAIYLMLSLISFIDFCKYTLIRNLMPATRFKPAGWHVDWYGYRRGILERGSVVGARFTIPGNTWLYKKDITTRQGNTLLNCCQLTQSVLLNDCIHMSLTHTQCPPLSFSARIWPSLTLELKRSTFWAVKLDLR